MDAALLDTDTLSEVLKGRHPHVVRHAAEYLRHHPQFAVSSMTRYELLRGLKERGATTQIQNFADFCHRSLILKVSNTVLDRATHLWVLALRGGFSGRDADLIIAATVLESQRVLVTGNTVHFSWIPALQIADWRDP